jgi:hypothetical protein
MSNWPVGLPAGLPELHNSMRYGLLVFLWIGLAALAWGQREPFSVRWSFEGNQNGASSVLYITPSNANLSGTSPANFGPYGPGQSGQAINLSGWKEASCDRNEYAEFTVQPNRGQTMTLKQFSFFFARSAAGPQQISVRSSVNGFSSDVYNGTATESYQQGTVGLSGGSYTNQSGPITFRVYACPPNGGGVFRLDEVTISGELPSFALPVELLYFRAQPQGNAVGLSWATTWERNAGKFTIQRSRNLVEFLTIGEVAATGNTDSRQTYAFTDLWPDAGTSYYRLLQTDRDGTTQQAKPVAVTLDDDTPTLAVLENPANAQNLSVATRNLTGATFRLISLTGQPILLSAEDQANNSTILRTNGLVSVGLYWLQAIRGDGRVVGERVLIR